MAFVRAALSIEGVTDPLPPPVVINAALTFRLAFVNAGGAPVAVTGAALLISRPDGVELAVPAGTMDAGGTGAWLYTLPLDQGGQWRFRAACDDAATPDLPVTVTGSALSPALPTGPILVDETGLPLVPPEGGLLTLVRVDRTPAAASLSGLKLVGVQDDQARHITGEDLQAAAEQAGAATGSSQGSAAGASAGATAGATAGTAAGASSGAAAGATAGAAAAEPFSTIATTKAGEAAASQATANASQVLAQASEAAAAVSAANAQALTGIVDVDAGDDGTIVFKDTLGVYGEISPGRFVGGGVIVLTDPATGTRSLVTTAGVTVLTITAAGVLSIPGYTGGLTLPQVQTLFGGATLVDDTLGASGVEYLDPDGQPYAGLFPDVAALGGLVFKRNTSTGERGIYSPYGEPIISRTAAGVIMLGGAPAGTTGPGFSESYQQAKANQALGLASLLIGSGPPAYDRTYRDFLLYQMYGQSNSTDQQAGPVLSKAAFLDTLMIGDAPFSNNDGVNTWTPFGSLVFNAAVAKMRSTTNVLLDDAGIAALAVGDSANGSERVVGWINYFRQQWLDMKGTTLARPVGASCGQGGRSIEELSYAAPGSLGRFSRLVDNATKALAIAAGLGKTLAVNFWEYDQGEDNYGGGAATTDKATYKGYLKQLRLDHYARVCQAVLGQTRPPIMLVQQTDGQTTKDNLDLSIGMAQLEASEEDPFIVLIGPRAYTVDRGLHYTSNGNRHRALMSAKVAAWISAGKRWKPLSPLTIEWTNLAATSQVWMTFHVPCPPLDFADPYLAFVATADAAKGFSVIDSIGTANITAVAIKYAAGVLLTCDRQLVGPVYVRQAGYATAKGMQWLVDSDPTIPPFSFEYVAMASQDPAENIAALVGKPYDLRNRCVAFHKPATYVAS